MMTTVVRRGASIVASGSIRSGRIAARAVGNHVVVVDERSFSGVATSERRTFREVRAEGGEMRMPPNLRIDPRSTISPFYGLDQVEPEYDDGEEEEEEEEEEEYDDEHENVEDQDAAEDDEDEYDDDEEDVVYSLRDTPLTEPVYVVPLPERLHVPVYALRPDSASDDDDDETPERVGTLALSPAVFGADPVRPDLLHRVVVYQRNKRRGRRYAARSKTISEVSGSGRKVRPQKGQGRARAGHGRPAHWRGGAKAHGPKGVVQNYETKLNKKVRRLGLVHALSQKLKEGNLVVVDAANYDSHRTTDLARALRRLGAGGDDAETGATALLAVDDEDDEEERTVVGGVDASLRTAASNLLSGRGVQVVNQLGVNVYDVLRRERLILDLNAVKALEKRLS